MGSIHKVLTEIEKHQTFEQLDSLKDSPVWSEMNTEERRLFAKLLMAQGSIQLKEGNQKVLDTFSLASQVSSNDPDIWYEQGLLFLSYPQNRRCLQLAADAFRKTTQLNARFFMAWYKLADTLVSIGNIESDFEIFIEALSCMERASQLAQEEGEYPISKGLFFWRWANCLEVCGKLSGEPLELYQAIEKFQAAAEYGVLEAAFFNDYGEGLANLGFLIDNPELFIQALSLFEECLQQEPHLPKGLFNKACCLFYLAEVTGLEDYLQNAKLAFLEAEPSNRENHQFWVKWGQLETIFAKMNKDNKLFDSALQKFQNAYNIESDDPYLLNSFAELELLVGSQDEKPVLLESAKNHILHSLDLQSENPDSWYLYGSCLNELGHYFEKEECYNEAIQKFQYGLSLSSQHPLLWYGLALANFALGQLKNDRRYFEHSVHYCSKVIECGGAEFPQFWNDWGVALLRLGEISHQRSHIELAIDKFERAFRQSNLSFDSELMNIEWMFNYGCAVDLLGELTEDINCFEKALHVLNHVVQRNPTHSQARYHLALAWCHLAEEVSEVDAYYKAVEHFQVLIDSNGEDENYRLDYGIALIHLALLIREVHAPERTHVMLCEAENQLMQSAALGNAQAYYQLASLYSLTEHFDQAMQFIERAYQSGSLPSLDELLHDEWLENLRQIDPFRQFLHSITRDTHPTEE